MSRSSNDIRDYLGLEPETALLEIVRRTVGFMDAEDLKRRRDGSLKTQAHASRAPFQIILRLTAKAIAKEDGVKLPRHGDLHELQQLVAIEHAEMQEDICVLEDLGVQPWHVLYQHSAELKEPRWVLDIAFYTNEEERGQLALYGQNKTVWKPLRPGWNKHNNSIVIYCDTSTMLLRWWASDTPRNVFRFGPILTAYLAAMSQHTPNRWHVILYAVREIKTLQAEDESLKLSEHHRYWYALHTLRRMYRMRWGISLFPQPELSGRLSELQLQHDAAYQQFMEKTRKLITELQKK